MLWILAIVAGATGAALASLARRRHAALRPIADGAEGRSIGSLAEGRFRVAGRVVPIVTSPSAVDGLPCVYRERAEYRLVGTSFVPLLREVERDLVAHPFYLDDGTGRLLVDPAGAVIDAATLDGDDGLTAERRLRADEEIELVGSFRPAVVEDDGGPYRAPALAWEAFEDVYGPPRITHRTEKGMMVPLDDVVALMRGTGIALVALAAVLGILAVL